MVEQEDIQKKNLKRIGKKDLNYLNVIIIL